MPVPSYVYRKITLVSPGLIFVQKAVLLGLFSGGAYFRRGLLLEGILLLLLFFGGGGGGGLIIGILRYIVRGTSKPLVLEH